MNYDEALSSAEKTGTERRNKRRPAYRWATWGIGAAILTAVLIWLPGGPLQTYKAYKNQPKPLVGAIAHSTERVPGDCTYTRPCTPVMQTDGKTVKVALVPGKKVCFDPPVRSNPEGFGLMLSVRGGPGRRYSCTAGEESQGLCVMPQGDTFWFEPKPGVEPSRYWFLPLDADYCQ